MGKQVHSRGYKSGPGGWSSVGGWAADKSSKQLQHEVLKGSTDKPALCVNFRRPREPKTDLLISLLLYYILELCHPCHVTHYTLCRIMLPHYASFSRADTKSAIRKKFLFIIMSFFFLGQARHLKHSTIVRPSSVVYPDLWAHIFPPHLPWNASPASISSSQDSSTFPFLALACALDILLAKFRLLCWPEKFSLFQQTFHFGRNVIYQVANGIQSLGKWYGNQMNVFVQTVFLSARWGMWSLQELWFLSQLFAAQTFRCWDFKFAKWLAAII